jgi:hypothetical protein
MIETTRGLIFDKKTQISKSEQYQIAKIEINLEHGEEIIHKLQKIQELKYSQLGDLYLTNYKVRVIVIFTFYRSSTQVNQNLLLSFLSS